MKKNFSIVLILLFFLQSCKKDDLKWDLPRTNPLDSAFPSIMPPLTMVESNNCSTLNGINSSYSYWNGTGYSNTAWTISNNGYNGTCWSADMSGVSGTGPIGTRYVQFSRNFSNNGFITFWFKTVYNNSNNLTPIIYLDGLAQESPIKIGGQTSSSYFMQVQSSNISAGYHTVKIEFNLNYYKIYVDEIEFYEY